MSKKKETRKQIDNLSAYNAESSALNVIIDTPQGSRNKYKFDEQLKIFKLGGVLPSGAVFPFNFGYVPATKGEDGGPLDVLVLMDEPAFVGCLIESRLIGVIEAEQTEEGRTERNDRLIAVAAVSRNHQNVNEISELNENLVHEIEHFFISYNQAKGKEFKVLGRGGAKQSAALIEQGSRMFRRGLKKRSTKK
ncbi:MAG TPA: inorganic diphosphatase [Blastocatellia bacterium]|nr:inorganic diphosphatase [Blastocatellia bacterium]